LLHAGVLIYFSRDHEFRVRRANRFSESLSLVFAAMKQHDLVLNLHGERPGVPLSDNISLEEAFLSELTKLHEKFPRLRCVLEVNRSSSLTA
jgi:dihydroorotase